SRHHSSRYQTGERLRDQTRQRENSRFRFGEINASEGSRLLLESFRTTPAGWVGGDHPDGPGHGHAKLHVSGTGARRRARRARRPVFFRRGSVSNGNRPCALSRGDSRSHHERDFASGTGSALASQSECSVAAGRNHPEGARKRSQISVSVRRRNSHRFGAPEESAPLAAVHLRGRSSGESASHPGRTLEPVEKVGAMGEYHRPWSCNSQTLVACVETTGSASPSDSS